MRLYNKYIKVNILIVLLSLLIFNNIFSQDSIDLSLNDVISIARNNSLRSQELKTKLFRNDLEFENIFKDQYPNLSLTINPLSFQRSMIKRYDYNEDVEIFRQQVYSQNQAYFSVTQNIPFTGGTISLNSGIERYKYDENPTQYAFSPFSIGYHQPINNYNVLKWKILLETVNHAYTKKKIMQDYYKLAILNNDLFFKALISKIKLINAKNTYQLSDSLLKVFSINYKVDKNSHYDFLQHELLHISTKVKLLEAENQFQNAVQKLCFSLHFDLSKKINPLMIDNNPDINISLTEAIEYAIQNSPDIAFLELNRISSESEYDKLSKANAINFGIYYNFGLNNTASSFNETLSNQLNQQSLNLSINVPITTWGKNKNFKKILNYENEEFKYQNLIIQSEIEETVKNKLDDFNDQSTILEQLKKADSIATESYKITLERYYYGLSDITDLIKSIDYKVRASEDYILGLSKIWNLYYELEFLTGFNFIENKAIDFENK